MPEGPQSQAYTFVGGSNLMMFKSSKNKDAAWELIKFLSQDQVQTDYANLMGMFPARKEAQSKVGEQDDNHKQFFAAIQQGRTYAPIPQWGRSRTPTRPGSATSSTRRRARASPTRRRS
jgi:multiple sugar transport system substrate-binding protein